MGSGERPVYTDNTHSLIGLQRRYDLTTRERDLMNGGSVTFEYYRDLQNKEKFARSFLDSAEALQARAGTTSLRFAAIPRELTPYNMDKIGMRLLSVPVLPLHDIKGQQDVRKILDVRKMYGGYLQAAEQGHVPTNDTGHYTFIDAPGNKTALSTMLGINDLREASLKDIEKAISEKGKDALKHYGYYTERPNVEIDVISAEEAVLSAVAGHPVDGITSTYIKETGYVYFKNGKPSYHDDIDTDVSPRLVLRFGKRTHND